MRKLSTLLLSLLLACSSFATITINIVSPTNNQVISGSTVTIKASVTSTQDLASVIAFIGIGAVQTNLVYNSTSHYYEGTLPLSSFAQGSLTLEVQATDIFNATQSATRNFIYDLAPIVNIVKPLSSSVARPSIDFKIIVTDVDTCTIKVQTDYCYSSSGGYLPRTLYQASIVDSFETTFNLSPEDGMPICLKITVTDKRGSVITAQRQVYVTKNSFLEEVYGNKEVIRDFRDGKLLSYNNKIQDGAPASGNTAGTTPKITNISSGAESIIPAAVSDAVESGFISDYGALYSEKIGTTRYLQDWNGGTLYPLGQINAATDNLEVKGKYAIWNNSVNLYKRDLLAKANVQLSGNTVNWRNNLVLNGVVAYGTAGGADGYNIFTNNNGIVTQLTNDNASVKQNVFPRASENYVVYKKKNPVGQPQSYALYLYNGQTHSQLADWGTHDLDAVHFYQVSGKFVAFTKYNLSAQQRTWLRDSLGNDTQLSFAGTSGNNIADMNSKGDVWFDVADTLYLKLYNGALYSFPNFNTAYEPFGRPYYRDSSWYLSIGRMLYRVNTGIGISQLCPSSDSVQFTSSLSGASYQWQVDTGNGVFTNITNNVNYVGANTATLKIRNVPSSWYGYNYRCVIETGSYGKINSLRFGEFWTGFASTVWEDSANWSCGTVPDSFTDVIVNSGATLIINSNVTIRSLKLNPGASFTVSPGFTLTILH